MTWGYCCGLKWKLCALCMLNVSTFSIPTVFLGLLLVKGEHWQPLRALRETWKPLGTLFPFYSSHSPISYQSCRVFFLSSLLSIPSSHPQYFWWSLDSYQPLLGLVRCFFMAYSHQWMDEIKSMCYLSNILYIINTHFRWDKEGWNSF